MIYLQVTRGAPGDRDFVFPDPETTPPTVVLFTQSNPKLVDSPKARKGIKVVTIDDLRWGRRDIKTVQLLYPSMGKMMAIKQGADDAWMVQDGAITEGTSNNAYIIKDGKIVTRALSNDILHGITRAAVLRFAPKRRCRWKSAISPWKRRGRRMKPSSPLPAPLSCRWCRSTGRSLAAARPAPWPRDCARFT